MDKREDILVRLLAILEDFKSDGTAVLVKRNFDIPNEIQRPALLLYDADELAEESTIPNSHAADGATMVKMVPQIRVVIGAKPEDVGTKLNAIAARLKHAIMTDATLKSYTRRPGRIRYIGADTALGWSRTQDGDMVVRIGFTYMLNPAELGPANLP